MSDDGNLPTRKRPQLACRYYRLDPDRIDAVVLVFLHVLREAIDAGVLQPKREFVWVKQNPTHLAVHLRSTVAALGAGRIFPIDRVLLRNVVRRIGKAHSGLLAPHAPIVYFDGKRDRRVALVLNWPNVLQVLRDKAALLNPAAPRFVVVEALPASAMATEAT